MKELYEEGRIFEKTDVWAEGKFQVQIDNTRLPEVLTFLFKFLSKNAYFCLSYWVFQNSSW
jgi:hypothetical protein